MSSPRDFSPYGEQSTEHVNKYATPNMVVGVIIDHNRYRPYSHKEITINNYVNCPSIFAFARLICRFHLPIVMKILM